MNNEIQLMHGDCLEKMKEIPSESIDLILCDPPYGTTACKWDSVIPLDKMWEHYSRIIKDSGAIVLFGSEPFSSQLRTSNLKRYKYDWKWQKESGTGMNQAKNMPLKDYEDIMVFSKASIGHIGLVKNRMPYNPQGLTPCNKIQRHGSWGMEGTLERKSQKKEIEVFFENYPRSVLNFNRDDKKLHPTQKPVALLSYLIKTYTNENDVVLDNTMGSGSTGVAAIQTDRNFIGIEMDDKYFSIAEKRIREAKKERDSMLF